MSTLIPMGENILLEPISEESVTQTGIVLPDTGKDKPGTGKIIAIGEGKILENGEISKIPGLEVNDIVYFTKYSSDELDVEVSGVKKKYLIVKYSNILAKKSKDKHPHTEY